MDENLAYTLRYICNFTDLAQAVLEGDGEGLTALQKANLTLVRAQLASLNVYAVRAIRELERCPKGGDHDGH